MSTLVIASHNKGKVLEIKALLHDLYDNLLSFADIDLYEDIPETGSTFLENAMIKAKYIQEKYNHDVLADDSGLLCDALDGRPGIYSARFAGENKTDKEKCSHLLEIMQNEKNRAAHFTCAIVCLRSGKDALEIEGHSFGKILYEPVGENGFGFDPIFYNDEIKKTFAQMTKEEKNIYSHRAIALKILEKKLREDI